jgi:hypothetical protein
MIQSRRIRWVVHVVCMGEMRNSYKILAGKPEGKRPCTVVNGRIVRERRMEGVRWIHLARVLLVISCEHGNKPLGFIEGGEFLDQLSILLASQ